MTFRMPSTGIFDRPEKRQGVILTPEERQWRDLLYRCRRDWRDMRQKLEGLDAVVRAAQREHSVDGWHVLVELPRTPWAYSR